MVVDVRIEGLLGADLHFLEIGHDGPIIDPGGPLLDALGIAAEDRPQHVRLRSR